MLNWLQQQVPFCISSYSRKTLPCQDGCSHLSCKWYTSECQRMVRQWHLEPQSTHQTPIIKWDHVGKICRCWSPTGFFQRNKTSGHRAIGACFSIFPFLFFFPLFNLSRGILGLDRLIFIFRVSLPYKSSFVEQEIVIEWNFDHANIVEGWHLQNNKFISHC